MKISNNIEQDYSAKNNNNKPVFKAGMVSLLNTSGNTMQWIENQGFLASFLIQDFGGMTVPRTIAGFLRDKEETGHYNKQEGLEVFGREGLTGPCMMAVAPIALFLAAKCGKTTSVNSKLIKRFGNSLKEIVSKPEFDKSILKTPEKFKEEFYRTNIQAILENTVGKENTSKDAVEYILQQIKNMEKIPDGVKLKLFRGKSKYRSECMNNIVEYLDNLKYSTNSDLEMLQKVKFGSDTLDSKKVFSTKDTIDSMIKYADDAISANRNLEKLNALEAENIRDKSLAKRLITTISMITATLGVLSVLPKLYARSNVAPGARKKTEETSNDNKNVSFKGKNSEKNFIERILKKLGAKLNKNKSDFVSDELEYNGHNFTSTLMAGLSIFGLLLPRGFRAYSRAQVDEDGKKDLTELYEIILRDITSSLAVVFAVPMLTRASVTSYEKNSGFVLMQKDRSSKPVYKRILDLFNPYSKAHVMTNAEINSLYNNINSKEKMLNFCKYIDKNGGDLYKILSKANEPETLFANSSIKLASLKNMSKNEKNKNIISVVEKLSGSNANEVVQKLMKPLGKMKNNKITLFARGLTSIPALLTTFAISPYILGWFIPRLTYSNTRRIHEKQDRERELKKAHKLQANV